MKKRMGFTKVYLYTILGVYAFISIYPLIWLIFYSLKNNQEIFVTNPFGLPKVLRWENYLKALGSFDLTRYFFNSVIVSVCSVCLIIIITMMFSYATARMQLKYENALRLYILSGMFIPANIILIPLAVLMNKMHLYNTRLSVIIAYTAFGLAFSSTIFYGFFRTLPFELEESAFMDGANVYIALFKIILPMVKPATATVFIFNFLSTWNEFNIALVLLVNDSIRTLPLGLMYFMGRFMTDWGAMGASMVIACIPSILIYLFFSEKVEQAMTVASAVKG